MANLPLATGCLVSLVRVCFGGLLMGWRFGNGKMKDEEEADRS